MLFLRLGLWGGGGAVGRFKGFLCPMPETTVFVVVSGTHTGVVLAHVPETTSFIVVSGTWGDEDKLEEEEKEEANQDSKKHKKQEEN